MKRFRPWMVAALAGVGVLGSGGAQADPVDLDALPPKAAAPTSSVPTQSAPAPAPAPGPIVPVPSAPAPPMQAMVAPPPPAPPSPPVPVPGATAPATSSEARASEFLRDYFAAASGSNDTALAFIAQRYSLVLNYYGHVTPRDRVLLEKRNYMARWPVRTYQVEPNSVQVTCSEVAGACTASGTIDWICRSPERHKAVSGSSRFDLALQMTTAGTTITGEAGRTLTRDVLQ